MSLSLAATLVAALNGVVAASNLYVSSYNGNLDSLSVWEDEDGLRLSLVDSNTGCGPSPAWLTWDQDSRVLYCLDEGLIRNNSSVSSFTVTRDGILSLAERRVIPSGPSGSVIYDNGDGSTLALSH